MLESKTTDGPPQDSSACVIKPKGFDSLFNIEVYQKLIDILHDLDVTYDIVSMAIDQQSQDECIQCDAAYRNSEKIHTLEKKILLNARNVDIYKKFSFCKILVYFFSIQSSDLRTFMKKLTMIFWPTFTEVQKRKHITPTRSCTTC